MTVAKEFHNWSDHPSAEARRRKDGSPALKRIRDFHLARWGGKSESAPTLWQPRNIGKTNRLSAHAGCAVDLRWGNPGPGRRVVLDEMLPFYIGNSLELHIQAIHDYVGCRVWRAHRSGDANGGWKRQPQGSHDGNMGNPASQWLHLEVHPSGWGDDRSVEQMLGGVVPPPIVVPSPAVVPPVAVPPIATDLPNGVFGAFPLNAAKGTLRVGDQGDLVLYAKCVIFHKAGGAIERTDRFDEPTRGRVVDVQRLFSLAQSGEIDQSTWGALDFLAAA